MPQKRSSRAASLIGLHRKSDSFVNDLSHKQRRTHSTSHQSQCQLKKRRYGFTAKIPQSVSAEEVKPPFYQDTSEDTEDTPKIP
eukprot:7273221-Prymnesium_polylepis.1